MRCDARNVFGNYDAENIFEFCLETEANIPIDFQLMIHTIVYIYSIYCISCITYHENRILPWKSINIDKINIYLPNMVVTESTISSINMYVLLCYTQHHDVYLILLLLTHDTPYYGIVYITYNIDHDSLRKWYICMYINIVVVCYTYQKLSYAQLCYF